MDFLKRSLLAVTRRKGKSFILFVIFASVANMFLAGLAIQHATDYASILARQKLGGQLTLRFNMENALKQAKPEEGQRPNIQREPVTDDMVKTVASQKNIIDQNIIVSTNGIAEGFEPVVTDNDSEQDSSTDGNQPGRPGGFGFGGNFVMPDVTVTGVSSSKLVDSFSNGDARIIDGAAITTADADKKAALIEKNLAEQNELEVGEKIKIKASRADGIIEYKIVGIYEVTSSISSTGQGRNLPFTEPYNQIFVDYKSAIPLKSVSADAGVQSSGGIDQAVFFIDDPKNIEKVKAEAKSMNIDWDKFVLDANDRAYQQMMGPIENVASFSKTVVYMVAVAGSVILALVLMLSMKERMYETGVFLSIGEGKMKIIAQYVAEVLLIALVAFSLSVFSGNLVAQQVGDKLLQREIQVTQDQGNNNGFGQPGRGFAPMQGGGFGRGSQHYEAINTIDVQVTLSEVKQMSVAGLIIVIAGTILPAASVMRYRPKTILTKA